MNIAQHIEEERRWFRTRTRLKKGYERVFCASIRRRLSWEWIKADAEWKRHLQAIREYSDMLSTDTQLEKATDAIIEDFLINQNLQIK